MARLFGTSGYCYQLSATGSKTLTQTVCGWVYENSRVSGGGNPAIAHMLWCLNGPAGAYNEISSDNGVLQIAYNAFGWNNTAKTLSLATWAHVTTWCDGTNYKVFLNGSTSPYSVGGANGNTARNFPAAISGWTQDVAESAPSAGFFDGKVADFAVWSVALTDGEIDALANGAARPFQIRRNSLVSWLPLDGLSSPEPDFSGVPTNGTLGGVTSYAPGPPVTMFTPRWPRNDPFTAVTTVPLSQTHFRFRTDTGAVDATPTWGDTEDAA